MQFKLTRGRDGEVSSSMILKIVDGVANFVPSDPSNRDWQEYQAWLAADPENNIPEPAE